MSEEIEIGKIIRQKLQAKDLTVAWLARQVYCDESNFLKKLNNNNITVNQLRRISKALGEDLFICCSEHSNGKR